MAIPVSVVVLTKNEESNIGKCLDSVREFDEVFVVDSKSEDRTCEIVSSYANATVVDFEWNGAFPKKKQWALTHCDFSHPWVLYLDADEEVTPELAREIAAMATPDSPHAGFFVGYDNFFLGRRLRYGAHSMKLILLRPDKAYFDPKNEILTTTMWEVEGNYQPTVDGSYPRLKERAIHNDYKSLFQYFARHNRYSDLEALHRVDQLAVDESYPPLRRFVKALRRTPGAGVLYFLYTYILLGGFLDGKAGLCFALARLSYFIEIDCKVLELQCVPEAREAHYLKNG